jgi:aspartate oxidase
MEYGANRLASNSFLKALSWCKNGRAAAVTDQDDDRNRYRMRQRQSRALKPSDDAELNMEEMRHSLRKLMWERGDNTMENLW